MAAGQQKKRLTNSNLHEQYKGKKKKKLDSSDYVLSLRPHIYLQWDENKKQTFAKKEQLGITWTDMAPFVDSVPQFHSGLADVLTIPCEIFDLENLTEVLSHEVWATCLSESERKLLTQFLPSGTGAEQAVQSLLMGENHHFGNPFLEWSSSLCSGNLHPDNVLCMDRQFRANKKAYYSELNQYRTGMIEVLKQWKERWATCKDPEKLSGGFTMLMQETQPVSAEKAKVAPNSKKEILQKICIRNGDTAKYMSYIKISKQQYELVKSLKHCGDGFQSKSLNRVLGDITCFPVHPYEAFEEEEKNRLHEHWLQVVNKDLPAAFEGLRDKKLQREEWRISLKQELAEKRELVMDKTEEMGNPQSSPQEYVEDEGCESHPIEMIHQDAVASPNSTHDHRLERIPSLNGDQELSPMMLDQEAAGHDSQNPADSSPIVSHFLGEKTTEDAMEPRASVSPADSSPIVSHFLGEKTTEDVWQDVSLQGTSYLTTSDRHHYTSSGELSLRQPQATEERSTRTIDLERDILEHESGESVASALHMDSGEQLFYSYANQNREELLSPFPKEPGTLSAYPRYHMNDLKHRGLQFLMANENFSESGQFSDQFQEQQRLIGQRQTREKELFMHQLMSKDMYSNGRYPPSQGQLSSVEQHGLVALQPSVNGGLVGHNWFPEEHRSHNGWVGVESNGGQCMGDGANVDGSLFSVLSECRKLPSRTPYGSATSDQFMQTRNLIGGGIPNNDNIYMYATHQLKAPSSLDVAAAPSDLNMSWLNYPHQNASMHDSIGKPFLRSWNQ